jgi:hypothetical protein
MADYIITLPDGSQHTIPTGTIDNNYDIPLVGQDAINYGDDFATAFMRLLVNFADDTAPAFGSTRVAGQLWYDTTPVTGGLRVYDGSTWDNIALESGIVTIDGNQTINDTKTFSDAPAFTAAGTPFTVNSTTQVTNLNASLLEGLASTAFATAAQGLKADAAEVNIGNPPVDGYIYSSTSAGVRSWISPSAGSGSFIPVDIAAAASPNTMSVILSDDPTGSQDPMTTAGLTFNGSTNTLTTTTFVGNLTGTATNADNATTAATATVATTVTLTNDAGDTQAYVAFSNNATGDEGLHTNAGLLFNSSTATLTATNFLGNGSNITSLNAGNISSGTLAVGRGGTGVTTSTGSGSSFVLHTAPTFVTRISVPEIRNGSGGVDLQYNSVDALGTQNRAGSDNTSGAYVTDGNGTARDVGFNQMITEDVTTSQNLIQADAGHSYRATNSSGTVTFTTLASDAGIPAGAMWIIRNFTTSTGVVQINSASGDTLRHYDGSGTIKSSVGGANVFTLARGGVATVVKVSDGIYEMWGIGLTGGA